MIDMKDEKVDEGSELKGSGFEIDICYKTLRRGF
jgi:hypothetical protein